MPELNSVTRTRLWYIVAFFAADGMLALVGGMALPADNPLALPATVLGIAQLVLVAIPLGSFLFATRPVSKEDLHAPRRRGS
jgi:hypothetical protein